MQTTLTIQLDRTLIVHAQNYAKQQGKTVSQLIAEYFARLETPQETSQREPLPPITQSLAGVLHGTALDETDYKIHLEEKYL